MRVVKPFLLIFLLFLIFIGSCGFQINRNRITLPDGAQSISLSQIINESFTPGLDVMLKEILTSEFSNNSIPLKPQKSADLQLAFQIERFSLSKKEVTLNSQISYHHLFVISGNLSLLDNRTGKNILEPAPLSGSFLLENLQDKASEMEVVESRMKAVRNLGKLITEKLTQNF